MKVKYALFCVASLCLLAASAQKLTPPVMKTPARAYEHLVTADISLDGAWEMAYRPWAHETVDLPQFAGVRIAQAIPGYWEDMEAAFRAAGMKDEFRRPDYPVVQSFPIAGHADDTSIPQIRGQFYYRRTIELENSKTRKLENSQFSPAVLAFEGVRNHVRAWVNGRYAGAHDGFSTPFELPIPSGALHGGTNEIVLAVSNDPVLGYGDCVCGITTRALFRATGGVNGHVALRFLQNDLADFYVTTAPDGATFTLHAQGKTPFDCAIEGTPLAGRGVRGAVTLPAASLERWSPERPHLYTAVLSTPQGTCRRRFGIRTFRTEGEKFRLNGAPVYLRGVTEHGYFAATIHLPRDKAYWRHVTSVRKSLGFNFVRFHTFVPPAEYLEATDELGMLVHVESPNFTTESEYAALIAFARQHPSVVIYCTGNETRIDRLAEAYLKDIADLVHTRTDALFSPMSALRGVEYALMPGLDPLVNAPFRHNAERLARLAPFCDLFTSYQLGLTSYDSLDSAGPETLDRWGDAYLGKPRTSHEICIDGSYVDLSLEARYPADSPIRKTEMFSGIRRQLAAAGLLDRADTYFRNSCEWMKRLRKFTFEKLRAADRVAGYDFLGDINTHWHTYGYSVGLMDEFYNLKPGETPADVRRYNEAAVLLCDLGSDFNFRAGAARRIAFSASNYAAPFSNATLQVALRDEAGRAVWEKSIACGNVPNGTLTRLAACTVSFPESATVAKYALTAELAAATGQKRDNVWELYAFPTNQEVTDDRRQTMEDGRGGRPRPPAVQIIENCSPDQLLADLANGRCVVLTTAGPFKSLPVTFRIGMAGRCAGNYATVIRPNHPLFRDFPNENFCGWAFRRLMDNAQAIQLEADVPFDPVVDIASSCKCVIRQALVAEYKVGPGRLLVSGFNVKGNDPAQIWFLNRLRQYAASPEFDPPVSITPDQLAAILNAPLKSAAPNLNRARNPNDPSGAVRAGPLAQP